MPRKNVTAVQELDRKAGREEQTVLYTARKLSARFLFTQDPTRTTYCDIAAFV